MPNEKPPKEGAPTPDDIKADLEDLESALADYEVASPSTYGSDSGIGHCGELFAEGDEICCN